MKKRVLSALLALCMACGLAGSVLAETGAELTLPTATPAASTVEATPEPSAEPVPSTEPAASEEPVASATPASSAEPVASEVPATSETPAASEEPAASEVPVASEEPTASVEPVPSDAPAATEMPIPSATPVAAEESTSVTNEENQALNLPMSSNALAAYALQNSFLVTWKEDDAEEFITIELVDQSGNSLTANVADRDYYKKETLNLADVAPELEGYQYIGAKYRRTDDSDTKWTELQTVRAVRERFWSFSKRWVYYVDGKNIGLVNPQNNDRSNRITVQLIYEPVTVTPDPDPGTGGETEVDLPEPQISKTAVQNVDGEGNPDGTYSLNLSVSGSAGSQTQKINVDVLMLVDESNSMGVRDNRGNVTNKNGNLIPKLEEAMKALVNTLEGNQYVDARYSIVSFGTTGKQELGWTSMPENYDPDKDNIDHTTIGQAITGVEARGGNDGGTNYMAGFLAAQPLVNESNNDASRNAVTIVVFLSDGEPTYYYYRNWQNDWTVGGSGTSELGTGSEGWKATVGEAKNLVCDQFYSVGIGDASEDYLNTNSSKTGLVDVVPVTSGEPKYIDAGENAENLKAEFEKIAGSATDIYIENVTITDEVNINNVEQVPNTNLVVTISDSDPATDDNAITQAEINAGTIVPSYQDGVLRLDFDDQYELKPGYTYTVTMQIQPTETAKQQYANQQYTDRASPDTGTHANDLGIFSNVRATLEYYYTDNDEVTDAQYLEYPMPVIRVPEIKTGDLKITKAVNGDEGVDDALVENQTFTFTVIAGEGVDTSVLNDKEFNVEGGTSETVTFQNNEVEVSVTGTGVVTIKDLPLGTYTISEVTPVDADLGDYYYDGNSLTSDDDANKVTITAGEDGAIQVTNFYKAYRTITVEKVVDGNMGEKDRPFEFTVKKGNVDIAQADITADNNTPATVTRNGAFTLQDGGKVTISKVKQDEEITITETAVPGYETDISGADEKTDNVATVNPGSDNVTITFTNTRNVNVPTGLNDTSKPLALLALVALVGGATLTGNAVVRRRRRRQE